MRPVFPSNGCTPIVLRLICASAIPNGAFPPRQRARGATSVSIPSPIFLGPHHSLKMWAQHKLSPMLYLSSRGGSLDSPWSKPYSDSGLSLLQRVLDGIERLLPNAEETYPLDQAWAGLASDDDRIGEHARISRQRSSALRLAVGAQPDGTCKGALGLIGGACVSSRRTPCAYWSLGRQLAVSRR